jgi:DNA-binding transcriptional ArsR family regulator
MTTTNAQFVDGIPTEPSVPPVSPNNPSGVPISESSTPQTPNPTVSPSDMDSAQQDAGNPTHQVVTVLAALGQDTRLKLLEMAIEGPINPSDAANVLGLTIPTIVHHLQAMASAGLFEIHKSGRYSFYIVKVVPLGLAILYLERLVQQRGRVVTKLFNQQLENSSNVTR